MSGPTIPVPAELADRLPTGYTTIVLAGPDGQPVGYVVNPDEYWAFRDVRLCSSWVPPTRAELDRAEAQGGEHTTEEVFALLVGPECIE